MTSADTQRRRTATSRPRSTAPPRTRSKAPPEEYLYVVAMRTGTGVDAPDFLAVVDTRPGVGHLRADRARDADALRRRRAPPLRLEPLLVGLPRARTART